MHEPTFNNRLILQYNLITIAALKALLVLIALMGTVLHLLEVPYHAELANCCHQMALLFPLFSDLYNDVISEKIPSIETTAIKYKLKINTHDRFHII